MAAYVRSRTGQEPIDPAKVARVLLDVAELAEPPLHLLLGSDAVVDGRDGPRPADRCRR
jgi:hypothetical protein